MNTKQLASGLVIPVSKKHEKKKDYELLEVKDEDSRQELSRMFTWMLNYPCNNRGICLDSSGKQVQTFRYNEVKSLAKKLLGKDWSCEELC